MTTFLILFVIWIVVMLVGHGSWVVVRAFFSLFTDSGSSDSSKAAARPDKSNDIAAGYRLLQRMVHAKVIDPTEAQAWGKKLAQLRTAGRPEPPVASVVDDPAEDVPVAEAVPVSPEEVQEIRPEASPIAVASPAVPAELPKDRVSDGLAAPPNPIPEAISKAPTPPSNASLPAAVPPAALPLQPKISRAEIIRSFLAAHNIRWGELVAGLLIVVCSIGLVINLWSPLVRTHRVVPSLIFLAANAAIFAAGLYTLSRWKLRHTSRAVLIIATLLVPLSVLAGIAAVSTTGDAVRLNDPITLGTLLGGGLIYGWLLWLGGKALARPQAAPLTLGVAVPVAMLPLLPALVRTLSASAGWSLLVPSLAVLAATVWMIRPRGSDRKMGTIASRATMLVMGLSGFALLVAAGYAVIAILITREFHWSVDVALPISVALIPGWIALAGGGRQLMTSARNATHSMIGAVVMILALLWIVVWAVPAMSAPNWIYAWATVATISGVVAGMLLRQPLWMPLSTLPAGFACVVTSPVWLGRQNWSELSLWQIFFGGEPMLASAITAAVVCTAAMCVRHSQPKRWLSFAGMFWIFCAGGIASWLAVSSESQLGIASPWLVTMVLATAMVSSVVKADLLTKMIGAKSAVVAIVMATLLGWCSVLRPIELSLNPSIAPLSTWILWLLAVGGTLIGLGEATVRLRTVSRRVAIQLARDLRSLSVANAVLIVFLAGPLAQTNWAMAAWYLTAGAAIAAWSAMKDRSIAYVVICQSLTVAIAVTIGYGKFSSELFARTAWQTGTAPWGWSIVLTSLAIAWLLIRQLTWLDWPWLRKRLAVLRQDNCSALWMVDHVAAFMGLAILLVCVSHLFVRLLATAMDPAAEWIAWHGATPLIAVALSIGFFITASHRAISSSNPYQWGLSLATPVACLWGAMQLVPLLSPTPALHIFVVTSVAVTACGLWMAVQRRFAESILPDTLKLTAGIQIILLSMSSATLVGSGWLKPLLSHTPIDTLSTISVVFWSIVAAGIAWGVARIAKSSAAASASATLFVLATILIVPWLAPSTNLIFWIQVAAVSLLTWMLGSMFATRNSDAEWIRLPLLGSTSLILVTGLATAVLVLIGKLLGSDVLWSFDGWTGLGLSVVAVLSLFWRPDRLKSAAPETISLANWPIAVTLLSGQITWTLQTLAASVSMPLAISTIEIVLTVWAIAAALSVIQFARLGRSIDFCHATTLQLIVIVASLGLGHLHPNWLPYVGTFCALTSGCLVSIVGRSEGCHLAIQITSRLLGWAVIVLGAMLIDIHLSGSFTEHKVTVFLLWAAGWVVGWRLLTMDRTTRSRQTTISVPDTEWSLVLLVMAALEWGAGVTSGTTLHSTLVDPLWWMRASAFLGIAFSGILRGRRRLTWQVSFGLLVAVTAQLMARCGMQWQGTAPQSVMLTCVGVGFLIAALAYLLPVIAQACRLPNRIARDAEAASLGRLAKSYLQVVIGVAGLMICLIVLMLVQDFAPVTIQLSVVGVALVGWSVVELSELTRQSQLRHLAVTIGLIAVGLWATVDTTGTTHRLLGIAMQWLVVSVSLIAVMTFALPKLIGANLLTRWQPALHRGTKVVTCAAVVALLVMLGTEVVLHEPTGIPGVSRPMVIGVAVMLSVLSGIAGLIAVFSFGGNWALFSGQRALSDNHRRLLIIAAQVLGVITWLHIFLCNAQWAFAGLRPYWPFIVMGLAFLSVGITQWARRRGDQVLSDMLSHTAMYLPLIPVVGFWLGKPWIEWNWLFVGNAVRYDLVLALGAIYYFTLSALWKNLTANIAAVVTGNAAIWVLLSQTSNWAFLSHPQLWLIPPAVCVLVVAQMYRERLSAELVSGIRYACMLLIYISSTADMLLQEIGSNIMGPIVLISLALAGMLAGVVMQVRPFLYLGASFVLLGVTSMVWHAHRAMNAVWPWWIFGITCGVLLLAGLMAIEKNKDRLRAYANTLASWQG